VNARCLGVVMDWPEATWMASLNSTSWPARVPTAASFDPNTNAVQGCVARLLLVDAMRRVSRGIVAVNPTADDVDFVRPDHRVAWCSETVAVLPGAVLAYRRLARMTSAMRSRGSRLP
jgi:hypothetical protein